MLILNGKKFAKSDSEFTSSLFQSGGKCVGYYKIFKRQVQLLNMQKKRIGGINQHGVLHSSTKLDNEKYWHSYADIPEIGKYSPSKKDEDIKMLIISRDINGIKFK